MKPSTARRAPLSCLVALVAIVFAGCTVDDPASESDDVTASVAMPQSIRDYENKMGWNTHHLRWHTERQWNLLDPEGKAWAKKKGWNPARRQEGTKGNGLDFLAMHRVMIRTLVAEFPKQKALFAGWSKMPTKPGDKNAPKTDEAFDAEMLAAVDKLENHIGDFESDDALGLYLETKLRPTKSDPYHRTTDRTAGLHNYVHVRFADESSNLDLGDPSLNLQNKVFWRLHGWIDARWTAFRKAKGLSEDDAAYQTALQAAEDEMMSDMPKAGAPKGVGEGPPESLTKMFEQQEP